MMNANDILMWKRANELAEMMNVKIQIKTHIILSDNGGKNLGVFETSEQVFFFLCGYEHNFKHKLDKHSS